jgi:nucleoid DNA-binding protein
MSVRASSGYPARIWSIYLYLSSWLVLSTWAATTLSKMPNLTKRDMVTSISEEVGITQQETFAVIQKVLENIIDNLAHGNNVELRNFGVFEVRLTKPRVGRNPNQPEKDVKIPARAIVKFKPGRIMRQRVLLCTEELSKQAGL